jgi:hypothetical protein
MKIYAETTKSSMFILNYYKKKLNIIKTLVLINIYYECLIKMDTYCCIFVLGC